MDYVGETRWFAMDSVPGNFLKCDGTAYSRDIYSELFGQISISWGPGDGILTFNVPDCRNGVLVGASSTKAVGDTGGSAAATMPTHVHTLSGAPGAGTLGITPNPHDHLYTQPAVANNVFQTGGTAVAPLGSNSSANSGSKTLTIVGTPSIGTLVVDSAGGTGDNYPPYSVMVPAICYRLSNEQIALLASISK